MHAVNTRNLQDQKTMNAIEFFPFFGYSSIYLPFDEFLTKAGVTWRPKVGRKLDTTYSLPGTGMTMSFEIDASAKEKGIEVKSDGSFIFKELEVMLILEDKKNGRYTGLLPRGLAASDSRQLVESKLGTPKRRNARSDNFFLDGLVWTVAFQGDELQYIQFDVPGNGWRSHGICP
jgi:hypothetical protein